MKIFTNEFIQKLKSLGVCSWRGHRESDWLEEWWAPAHSTGRQVKVCTSCGKKLKVKKILDTEFLES